jgi:hypothetical protein
MALAGAGGRELERETLAALADKDGCATWVPFCDLSERLWCIAIKPAVFAAFLISSSSRSDSARKDEVDKGGRESGLDSSESAGGLL